MILEDPLRDPDILLYLILRFIIIFFLNKLQGGFFFYLTFLEDKDLEKHTDEVLLHSAMLGKSAVVTLACARGFQCSSAAITENGKKAVRLSLAELAVIFDSLQSQLKYLFISIRNRPVQDTSV